MKRSVAALLVLSGLAALPACSAVEPLAVPSEECAAVRCDSCSPAFSPDGRVRRDLATGAPVFVAASGTLASRAPRFNADGSVARDPETGAPIYEDVSAGTVVRVLVAMP